MTSKNLSMRAPLLNPRTHVKRRYPGIAPVSRETGIASFTDAEFSKNGIEDLLDIDAPRKAAQIIGRGPQSLRHEFQLIAGERRCPQKILDARRRDLLVTAPNQNRRVA